MTGVVQDGNKTWTLENKGGEDDNDTVSMLESAFCPLYTPDAAHE